MSSRARRSGAKTKAKIPAVTPRETEARAAIEQLVRRAATSRGLISLGGGLPSERQFPKEALAASFVRVLGAHGSAPLQYGWAEGQETLRTWIAARMRARGAKVEADDIIVTNGAQQAISIATRLLLRSGDAIATEPATYPAALELFRERRLAVVPLGGGQASYVMPTISNPRGGRLTAAQQAVLVASNTPIIEDDAYGELRFAPRGAPPLLARLRERTFHVGTFSKTVCPGLRVGWLVAPRSHRTAARRAKQNDDLQANSLAQAVMDDYLAHTDYDQRLARLRRFYQARAERLAAAFERWLPSWRFRFPQGGFSLWLEADGVVDERLLLETAIKEGVSFDVGSTFQAAAAQSGSPLRLRACYSYVDVGELATGVRRLARAWHRATRRRPRSVSAR